MSDYLGQLAARAQRASADIVPLRSSRFEPEVAIAPAGTSTVEGESTVAITSHSPASSASARLAEVDSLWHAAAPADSSPHTVGMPPRRPAFPSFADSPTDHNPAENVVHDRDAHHSAAMRAVAILRPAIAPAGSEPSRNSNASALAGSAEQSSRSSTDQSKPSVTADRPTRIVPTAVIEEAAYRRPAATNTWPRHPTASPRTAPSDVPPSVHITIGRVEVRATMQPSTRLPSASTRTAKVSLEEHLTGRSGGGKS